MNIMWVFVVLFLVLSIIFYMGKGGSLIAGYNTASQEERNRYDEKKLCRVMGNGMMVVTILLLAQVLFFDKLPIWIMLTGLLLDTLYILIVGNVMCKRDPKEAIQENGLPSKGISKKLSIAIGVGVVIVVILFLFSSSVSIETTKTALEAKATLVSTTKILYKDIDTIELKEQLDLGKRTNGIGDFKIQAGQFKNTAYGNYWLYSHNACDTYIVISLKDKSKVVINEDDESHTKKLYQTLQRLVP